MHVLFDLQHVLYMAISAVVTVDLLLLAHIYVKKQEHKNLILLLSAIITIVLHYSDLYVDYFTNNGEASIGSNHILPVFACNVMMWLLFACSLIKNKDGFWFKVIAEYCFYAGVVCGIIGILLNANYDNSNGIADWDIFKGLLSHSTMLFGCIYIKTAKFIKISATNIVSITLGLISFVVIGLLTNALFTISGMEPIDGMFLLSNDYIPFSPMVLGVPVLIIVFLLLWLYEYLTFKEQDKWQNKLKQFLRKIRK